MDHQTPTQMPVDTLTQEEEDDEKYAASRAYQAIKELKLVDKVSLLSPLLIGD